MHEGDLYALGCAVGKSGKATDEPTTTDRMAGNKINVIKVENVNPKMMVQLRGPKKAT